MKSFLIKSRGLKEDKIDVVYNWQDDDRFILYRNSERKQLRDYNFTFMFLGNLNRTSAIDIIISAFKTSSLAGSQLVIAGTGSEKSSLQSMVQNFQDVNIEFWEAPVMKVPEIQDKADILLLSLKKDAARFALPSKLPAYMFSGKPIIACVEEDTDVADIIKSANCGWIIPPEDGDKLANTMRFVYGLEKRELHKKGENGFDYAVKHFSKVRNLRKLTEIIKATSLT